MFDKIERIYLCFMKGIDFCFFIISKSKYYDIENHSVELRVQFSNVGILMGGADLLRSCRLASQPPSLTVNPICHLLDRFEH